MKTTAKLGRLRKEIEEGRLALLATSDERCRFDFRVKDVSIGCFSVQSTAPNVIRFARVWNIERGFAMDPKSGLSKIAHPPVRRFGVVQPGEEVFLGEMHWLGGHEFIDVAILAVEKATAFDGPITNAGRYAWEILELKVKCRGD